MEGAIINAENNAALPHAGEEPQFLQALRLRRNLSRNLYRVGVATAATAVAGLLMPRVAAASSHSLPVVLLLVVILLGAVGTVCLGYRLEPELAPSPLLREAGVAIYLVCLLMLVVAVCIVGSSDYAELALNFIDI